MSKKKPLPTYKVIRIGLIAEEIEVEIDPKEYGNEYDDDDIISEAEGMDPDDWEHLYGEVSSYEVKKIVGKESKS